MALPMLPSVEPLRALDIVERLYGASFISQREYETLTTALAGPQERTTWLCGCGTWNGVNLASCRQCQRPSHESDVTYQLGGPHTP